MHRKWPERVRARREACVPRQSRDAKRARQLRPIEVQAAARAETANAGLRSRLLPTRIKAGELALLRSKLGEALQGTRLCEL